MKDETIESITDALSSCFYSTKRVLRRKTGYSSAAIESVMDLMEDEGDVEKIYVKNDIGKGRPEAAYRLIE